VEVRRQRRLPGAGPSFVSGGGGFGAARGRGGVGGNASGIQSALAYVKAHGATSRFALVVSSETEAAPYVIRGESVASMGASPGARPC
jgi:hypothetical protein